jgi:ABC-type antimicrobial peptide transport system permease subunit
MVLREGAALVGFGLIIGLAGARALTRTIAGSLYNVSPDDVGTLVLVVATLVTVGIGACAVPAWRATRIDPLIALRND